MVQQVPLVLADKHTEQVDHLVQVVAQVRLDRRVVLVHRVETVLWDYQESRVVLEHQEHHLPVVRAPQVRQVHQVQQELQDPRVVTV
jgi:hypothetical protein